MPVLEHFLTHKTHDSNASHHLTLQTLQTPLPTFPISTTTLIIFLPIYKFILQKIFSPEQHDERYKTPFQLFQFPQLP